MTNGLEQIEDRLKVIQEQSFGLTARELREHLKNAVDSTQRFVPDDNRNTAVRKVACSMLSDVQELISLGMDESARKRINCIKFLLSVEV